MGTPGITPDFPSQSQGLVGEWDDGSLMSIIEARNVVLGAGAMGSAAAYRLARRGEPVLLVEQFAVGHDRGSSHGAARITRHSYADVRYARLMPEAFRAWKELEADSGLGFYVRTGGLSACPNGADYVEQVAASLAEIGCPHRRMTGAEVRRAMPAFGIADDADAVFEPDAGMIAASRAVEVQVELARRLGGSKTRVIENVGVRAIDLDADRPALVTDSGTIVADRLIVAAGAWTGRLLPGFAERLRPERQQVLYVRPDDPGPFAVGRLPVFIFKGGPGQRSYYGMPEFLAPGIKVARDGGDAVDPDADDRRVGQAYIEEVRAFLAGFLPGLAAAPVVRTEICKYTMAPDDAFAVDFLPGRRDVIVASPCSGHGFKFSALIGKVLADLAIDGKTDLDLTAWRIAGGEP